MLRENVLDKFEKVDPISQAAWDRKIREVREELAQALPAFLAQDRRRRLVTAEKIQTKCLN